MYQPANPVTCCVMANRKYGLADALELYAVIIPVLKYSFWRNVIKIQCEYLTAGIFYGFASVSVTTWVHAT
jgi:hypothetical protein